MGMTAYGLTDEVLELRHRMQDFIDGEVFAAEAILEEGGEQAQKTMASLKDEAKRRSLWALMLAAPMCITRVMPVPTICSSRFRCRR